MRRTAHQPQELHHTPDLLVRLTFGRRGIAHQAHGPIRKDISDLRKAHHEWPHHATNRTIEDHVASKNLNLPPTELERTPVEKFVEKQTSPLLTLDWSHAKPERERVDVH